MIFGLHKKKSLQTLITATQSVHLAMENFYFKYKKNTGPEVTNI